MSAGVFIVLEEPYAENSEPVFWAETHEEAVRWTLDHAAKSDYYSVWELVEGGRIEHRTEHSPRLLSQDKPNG